MIKDLLLPLILLFPKVLEWFKKKRKKPSSARGRFLIFIFPHCLTRNFVVLSLELKNKLRQWLGIPKDR